MGTFEKVQYCDYCEFIDLKKHQFERVQPKFEQGGDEGDSRSVHDNIIAKSYFGRNFLAAWEHQLDLSKYQWLPSIGTIGNYEVSRIMIDTGSSINIWFSQAYEECKTFAK